MDLADFTFCTDCGVKLPNGRNEFVNPIIHEPSLPQDRWQTLTMVLIVRGSHSSHTLNQCPHRFSVQCPL